ncbi:hypothetical protein JM79_2783 [Gramella sp. Hel_I_59]|uniref:hypothetical protein n=1 Tax=Gramella sp. Hel_I_59 TaxID=1249978 RepID=UPI00116FC0E1|nr:hypothetical protein [Gramella sp. Hel_I_59]TQI71832.1 hypothetical protein JM79_2783 [Gramella sp. Hel_I_59]
MDSMELHTIRLLLDFGLMVLIWIVQLVIYPGLCHYGQNELGDWHKKYTGRIGVIVGPLMILQLIVASSQLFLQQGVYEITSILFILALWLLTFLIFVPLHNAIKPSESCDQITGNLVSRNWGRTILWSVLFIITLLVEILD